MDFEDATQKAGFAMQLRVFDGRFDATAWIRVQLSDANDNAPEIDGPKLARVSEDVERGELVAQLNARDADAGDSFE